MRSSSLSIARRTGLAVGTAIGKSEGIFHEVVELVHVLEVAVADEFVALGPHGVLAHDAAPTPIIFASLEFNLRGGPHSGMAC
jgi:hypothetical protein